ncbi:MAG: 50S ribosomal protein L3 [Myxococcota bacterium]
MCRKLGMTQIFDDEGRCIPVTVLEATPNVVVQKKTDESDGYTAVQLGFGERRPELFSKPERGHFEKANVAPRRELAESRLEASEAEQYEVGQEIKCDLFEAGQMVDVIGTSKGRGTSGVVKRHGFAIKRKTHGTHEFFRHGGAIGAGAWPGKVIKGMKMAGRYGNERVTHRNAKIVKVDAEQNLLFVRGGVPGHRNAVVRVRAAVAPR